jgi:hypothetical protein
MRLLLLILLLPLNASASQAVFEDGALVSTGFPEGRIEIAPEFQHLGAESFLLRGTNPTEIHLFVTADPDGRVRRLLWVQFENFGPDQPERTFNYERDPERLELDGHWLYSNRGRFDFHAILAEETDDSDIAAVYRLLHAAGMDFGADVMRQRLVLLDRPRRHELMFIYGEDLANYGLTLAELRGDQSDRWPALRDRMQAGALEAIGLDLD